MAFGEEPMPRASRQTAATLLDWLDKHTNIVIKPIKSKNHRDIVLKAIYDTALKDYGVEPEMILSPSRNKQHCYLRSLCYYTYQVLTGAIQEEVVQAFGNTRNRSSYVNMKRQIINLSETYPHYSELTTEFVSHVQERIKQEKERRRKGAAQTTA